MTMRPPHAALHDLQGNPLGQFSLHPEGAHGVHCWEWFGEPWPATDFMMTPRASALPAQRAVSDVYPRPHLSLAHPIAPIDPGGGRRYDILPLDDFSRPLASLVVRRGRLSWHEGRSRGFHLMAPAPLIFRHRPAGATAWDFERVVHQDPIKLGASCGVWRHSA